MIRRVIKFNKQDWKHCRWLFKNMIKQFLMFEFKEAQETYYWLKIHLGYDSKRID